MPKVHIRGQFRESGDCGGGDGFDTRRCAPLLNHRGPQPVIECRAQRVSGFDTAPSAPTQPPRRPSRRATPSVIECRAQRGVSRSPPRPDRRAAPVSRETSAPSMECGFDTRRCAPLLNHRDFGRPAMPWSRESRASARRSHPHRRLRRGHPRARTYGSPSPPHRSRSARWHP